MHGMLPTLGKCMLNLVTGDMVPDVPVCEPEYFAPQHAQQLIQSNTCTRTSWAVTKGLSKIGADAEMFVTPLLRLVADLWAPRCKMAAVESTNGRRKRKAVVIVRTR